MSQSEIEVSDNINYRDWIYNYINMYKDWSLTHLNIKKHEVKQVSWS